MTKTAFIATYPPQLCQGMRWGEVAAAYRRVFERVAPAAARMTSSVDPAVLPAAAGA